MARKKVYLEERRACIVRLAPDLYREVEERFRRVSLKSFSAYVEKLIKDDLIIAKIEQKKELIEEFKNKG